ILIFDLPLNCHSALLQLRVHCVDVVNIDVECPVLVERDRMRRAGFVEENCYPLAPDDTECRRLAKEFARVKSELFAVKCFTRHYVLDFNRGGAVDDLYHRRNSITLKVGQVGRFLQGSLAHVIGMSASDPKLTLKIPFEAVIFCQWMHWAGRLGSISAPPD